jgi:PAS domain S-box-containing protein
LDFDGVTSEGATTEGATTEGRVDRDWWRWAIGASGMVGIWDGDSVAGVVYGDENFARMYGIDPAAAAAGRPSRYYFDFIHPDDVAAVTATYLAVRAGETDRFDSEHRIIRPDGGIVWLHARGRLMRDAAGAVLRFSGVSVDITARKQEEAQQAFLLSLQDMLRELRDPEAILQDAAAALGRHLGANRIGYGRVSAAGDMISVICPYAFEAAPITGEFPLDTFGAVNLAKLRAGITVAHDDVLTDPARDRDVWEEMRTRAHVSVPMLRDGAYRGTLFVSYLKPHAWTAAEISLIEAVAARLWEAAERSRAEATLRESEERARMALEAGGLGAWEYDIATGATRRSPQHDAMYGYPASAPDWTFRRFLSHVAPEERGRVKAGFRRALRRTGEWRDTFRSRGADGAERWISVVARVVPGREEAAPRMAGVVANVTEAKRAEALLVESERLFRSFAQAMPHHIWTSTSAGTIDWFNDRVPEYTGLDVTVLLGPGGWEQVVHPDDLPAVRDNRHAMMTGAPVDAEYRLRRADGVYRWFIRRAVPIRAADGAILRWLGTATDIEDQKVSADALAALNASLEVQMEQRTAELMAAEAALRQSQKMEAVGQLTGGIAHDFNNMLQGIAGAIELLERRIAQGRAAEIGRFAAAARDGVKRAANLTHQLLAFSRRQALAPKRVELPALIGGIAGLIQQTAGPAITFDLALQPDCWAAQCDPNQLENAILNLAINARDAMAPGGRLTIATGHAALGAADVAGWEGAAPGDYVRLSVSDTGAGMSPDVLEHAFEPFFTTKPAGQGTGLGLSQVYGFARQSNGILVLESQVGQGTAVHLYLPRHVEAAEILAPPAGDATLPVAGSQGGLVVLVEDEIAIRNFGAEVLREMGYAVLDAGDGASALKILRDCRQNARHVDLLVADVGLPGGLNGRQLADAAREIWPDLPTLLITGYAGGALAKALPPGMSLLTKPFTWRQLAGCVEGMSQARPGGSAPWTPAKG